MKNMKTGLIFNAEELTQKEESLLFLMPLVEMAWAHGAVSPREKRLVYEAAREDGIDIRDELNDTLDELLKYQPSQEFFADCHGVIENRLRRQTVKERRALREKLIARCCRVAAAAGEKSLMDVNHFISPEENRLLERLSRLSV